MDEIEQQHPSLFHPEEVPFRMVTLEIKVHMDGTSQNVEVWTSRINPYSGELISCQSTWALNSKRLAQHVGDIAEAAVHDTWRLLSPF